jgi:hypothetical protein
MLSASEILSAKLTQFGCKKRLAWRQAAMHGVANKPLAILFAGGAGFGTGLAFENVAILTGCF